MKFLKIFNCFKLPRTKPESATAEDWNDWYEYVAKNYPIRYFIYEIVPIKFHTFTRKFTNVKWWILYRTTKRYHVVKTGLKPGYSDCDYVLLHTVFNMLVTFVEIETASKSIAMDYEKRHTKYPLPWWCFGNHSARTKRYPEAALESLKWDMEQGDHTIDDPPWSQPYVAREIWIIYHWWKYIRPMRPDPHDISGLDAWYKANKTPGKHPALSVFSNKAITSQSLASRGTMLDLTMKIEANYDQEDDYMLQRLMKIRRGLWT